ncbi:hypothetical protein EON81_08425 [bacterium]|nr:MAG: hypothetical protein EON81_08425 [bacterium]
MIAAVLLLTQQKSLLHQRIPAPTGANGYEEFLRAADMISNDATLGKAVATMTSRPDDGEVIGVRRTSLLKLRPVLTLLRAGATKPIAYPPRPPAQDLDELISFDEISALRQLMRILMTSAYVQLADAQSAGATSDLIAVYRMADLLAHNGAQIEALTATGTYSQMFFLLDRSFDGFAPADLARIEEMADDAVERPFWSDVIKGELAQNSAMLDVSLKSFEEEIKGADREAVKKDPGMSAILKMTPAQKKALSERVKSQIGQSARNIAALGVRPEREWIPFAKDVDFPSGLPNTAEQVERFFADMGAIRMVGAVNFAAVRTKWRLVRLTARLRRIMAEQDVLPKELPADLPANYVQDGLAAGRLIFRSYPSGFSVESAGVVETGVVTLTSRLPKVEERDRP